MIYLSCIICRKYKEIFDRANDLAFTGQHKAYKGKACLLIYCGYCGRSMAAPKDGNHIRYRCMSGYGEFADENCKKSRIKAKDLEQTVLANVNLMAQIYAEKKQQCKSSVSEVAAVSDRIQSLKKEQERLKARKTRLYEEYRSDGNRDVYIKRKQQNDMRLAEIEEELQEAECSLEVAKQNETKFSMTEQVLNDVQMMDTFDREKLKKLIDRVNVYAEDEKEIIWKPMDVIFNGIAADKTSINISGNP